jgi:single-stranded-DNA-specific exonuclease
MKKQWKILAPDPEAVQAIRRGVNCTRVTATVLANRNIASAKAAADFLSPSLYHLRPPFAMQDMQKAVERIYSALLGNQHILVFGDYDADGVTATAILFDFLRSAGARTSFWIPHRVEEGYGLQKRHILAPAVSSQVDLIITADCGSSSHEAVAAASKAGIDVIITDHHTISDRPQALAVVNPKRGDCSAGLELLAGVGVAFCLIVCLRKHLREKQYWKNRPEPNLKHYCDLVAIGTIADMVPLVSDNRILAKVGIARLNAAPRPGLSALFESAAMGRQTIDADDIAYRLAPRLNAAGRMAHAKTAFQLLLAKDVPSARALAETLNRYNSQRQETENDILNCIEAQLATDANLLEKKTLTICGSEWHEGVLGIVASRLIQKYGKPAVVASEKNGLVKGSARSLAGVDLFAALSACKKDLLQFGGHALAAGLTAESANWKRFQENFEAAIQRLTQPEDFIHRVILDGEIFFEEISSLLIDELQSLAPFGPENPAPLFMAKNIEVLSSAIVGKRHRQMLLRQQGNPRQSFSAIQFNVDPGRPADAGFQQIAFRLQWNRWNGNKRAQLVIEET